MKVPSAALLFLASFGTTISSSNAKMVEFQVSSDGETNKQKKNVRKLQDRPENPNVVNCDEKACLETCADRYCSCADVCGLNNDDSDACITCVGAELFAECAELCSPCANHNNKEQFKNELKGEAKSSRAPVAVAKMAPGRRFLNEGDDGFNWYEFFQCKDDEPSKSPSPSMAPSISSAPSTSAAPTTDCGIIDCDMTHSASCNPGMYIVLMCFPLFINTFMASVSYT